MKSVQSPLVENPSQTPTTRAEESMPKTDSGHVAGEMQGRPGSLEYQRRKALLKTGALQDAIFNSANFSSIATDEKGVIQIFNVGAERMLGYAAADVINRITPADISDPQEVIARAQALSLEFGTSIAPGFEALVFKASRGIEDIYELTYIREDGSRFPAVVSVTALRDIENAIIGYLLIGTDNTARKRAEEALLRAGALQSAIFTSANFSSIATDAKGVIQIFNVGAERMLGYTAAEVMNKITPADLSDPQEVIERAQALSLEFGTSIAPGFEALVFKASRGIEDIYELTKIRKDGSRFPAVVSVTALRDAENAIIGYLLIGTDNTARKQAEEALLRAGALQSAIFNSANFSSIATDAKGVIQIFNVGAERMLGYAAAEVMNKITPADISDPKEVIARAKALSVELGTQITPGFDALVFKASRGIEDIYELTYIRKDGSRFPAVVSVTALRDAQGGIIGYLLIGTDNTARKRAEEALVKAGALQSAIFNSANFSSIATDAKGVIQIFNVGAERMLGYAAAEVMNKITPADISDPKEVIARAKTLSVELGTRITPGFEALVFKASRGIEDIYELTYIRKDGSRFPAVVSVTALRDAQGGIIGYLLIGTDNTARKRAEDALVKAGALQSAIFNSANFSCIATDAKGVIQIFNVGAERMLGYTTAEVVDQITPADLHDSQEVIARARALSLEFRTSIAPGFEALVFKASRGIEDIYELTKIRKNGSRFPAVVSVTALRDAQNAIIGYLLIGTDNTARGQAEFARIERTNHDLVALNEELKAFSYSVSHDLRGPLRSMDGFSLALLEDYGDKLDEEGKDSLQRIRAASQRMGHLIDDLLRLSQVTRAELKLTQVDLSAIAREIAGAIDRNPSDRPVQWAIESGLSVRADPALMRIAMQNLLQNARKFTGRIDTPVIRVGALERDGEKLYFVADNGVGFDMAHAANLLGAFQRLHHADDFPGTGIGLAIVQRIIRRHDGKIWAEAKEGEGATFFFSVKESTNGSDEQDHPTG
jgi:PAS domain-containing protein